MLRRYAADLHVHTCLSPCAEVGMSPAAVVTQAHARGIQILGICDHNSAENTAAALEVADRLGLHVLPGLEISSVEEVHLLALFEATGPAWEMQEIVYQHLEGENDEDIFGLQVIANADDEVLGFNPRLLIGATTLSVDEIVRHTHAMGGLSIAAHVDRESFSLIGQLGFVPDDLALDALEISPNTTFEAAERRHRPRLPLVQSSDAHCPGEIGRCVTRFLIERVSIEEIRKALIKQDGRRIVR